MLDNNIVKLKARTREIFASKGRKVRVCHCCGKERQNSWSFGPRSLISKDPQSHFATVFLWFDGGSLYQVIGFPHSDIDKLPLEEKRFGSETFRTMFLRDFPKRYVFASLEDLERDFPWAEHVHPATPPATKLK